MKQFFFLSFCGFRTLDQVFKPFHRSFLFEFERHEISSRRLVYRAFYAQREQQKRFVCFGHLQFGLSSAGARSSDGLVGVECELTV